MGLKGALLVCLLCSLISSVIGIHKTAWQSSVMASIRDGNAVDLEALFQDSPGDITELLGDAFCNGLTPLQFAAKTNFGTLPLLLERGADPRLAHQGTLTTPLMFAARSGEYKSVEYLLDILNVDDVNAIDEHGSTALALCSLSCHSNVAALMLKAGANTFAQDNNGNNALHTGAFYCADNTADFGDNYAKTLLQNSKHTAVELNALSKFGRTALMLAAKKGGTGYAEALLSAGADASIISPYDQKTYQEFVDEYQLRKHGGEL
jgi:ankyrin repeat protein